MLVLEKDPININDISFSPHRTFTNKPFQIWFNSFSSDWQQEENKTKDQKNPIQPAQRYWRRQKEFNSTILGETRWERTTFGKIALARTPTTGTEIAFYYWHCTISTEYESLCKKILVIQCDQLVIWSVLFFFCEPNPSLNCLGHISHFDIGIKWGRENDSRYNFLSGASCLSFVPFAPLPDQDWPISSALSTKDTTSSGRYQCFLKVKSAKGKETTHFQDKQEPSHWKMFLSRFRGKVKWGRAGSRIRMKQWWHF